MQPANIYTVETVNNQASETHALEYEIPAYNWPSSFLSFKPGRITSFVFTCLDYISVVPSYLSHQIDWMTGANEVAYINLLLAQDEVNQKLPWDINPFYWTNPASPNVRVNSKREKLRITTLQSGFKPIDLNMVRKNSFLRLEDDPDVNTFAIRAYRTAQFVMQFVPFIQLKTLVFIQASLTTVFVVGLSATLLRLAREAFSEHQLSLDLFKNGGYWVGFIGICYFFKMLMFQWNFGVLQDHWVIIFLIFATNLTYLAVFKHLMAIVEFQNKLITELCIINLLYFTYSFTYAISYPRLTFIVYQLALIHYLGKYFIGPESDMFDVNLNTVVENPENLGELMRINLQDIVA